MTLDEIEKEPIVWNSHISMIHLYLTDNIQIDESDPDTKYLTEIYIHGKTHRWDRYPESYLSNKTANEQMHHMASSCKYISEMSSLDKHTVLEIILDGTYS